MARRIAPNSTPFNCWQSKPGARRASSECPRPGIGPSCFSAQPKAAPTWRRLPERKARAPCASR
eukprot:1659132-Alexandrium_andersonii.AAC.1